MTPLAEAAIKLSPSLLGEAIQRPLDPWQREVVDAAVIDRQDCCLRVGRQSGKTESAAQIASAVLAIPALLQQESSLVVLTSPSQRQSSEIHRRVLDILDRLQVAFDERNRLSLKLDNGSRFLALPGSQETLRGISAVDLLLLDEAAYVDPALISAIRPMLAVSGGNMVMLSTPADPIGFFHVVATGTDDTWRRWHIPTSACPRVSPEFLKQERQLLGPEIFAREYEAEFVSLDGGLLTPDELAALRGTHGAVEAPRLADLAQPRERRPFLQDIAQEGSFRLPELVR